MYCLWFSLHSQNNSYNSDLLHAIAVFFIKKISWASARDEVMRRGVIIPADVVLVIVLSAVATAALHAACRAIYYPKSQWWSPVDEKWSVLRVSTTTGRDRIITGLNPCTLMSPNRTAAVMRAGKPPLCNEEPIRWWTTWLYHPSSTKIHRRIN